MSTKIKIEARGYGIVQRDFMTMDISIYAKCIYALLRTYSGDKHSCYPSLSTICDDLKISKPTAIKGIKDLEKINMIAVKRSKKTDSQENSVNVYIPLSVMVEIDLEKGGLDDQNDQLGGKGDLPRGKGDLLGVVKEVYCKNNNINTNIEEDLNLISELRSDSNKQVLLFNDNKEVLTLNNKGQKQKNAKPKKEAHPAHVPVRSYWFEEFNKGARFQAGDGEHINRIILNIESLFKSRDWVSTPESILDFFKILCKEKVKSPNTFISTSGLNILGSADKFMSIVNSIENGNTTKQQFKSRAQVVSEGLAFFRNL